MKKDIAVASLRSIKSSPQKIMRLSKSIKGMNVARSLTLLQYSRLKASVFLSNLIKSAAANAENNHSLDATTLYIKEINVGKAKCIKRFVPRGRGKSSTVRKHYANISVKLSQ